jgi:hypothetical protein
MDHDSYGAETVSEDDRESLRFQFKPKQVKFLFIGESPPGNPKKFFYKKKGALFDNTRKAFSAAGAPWAPETDGVFLEHFASLGCYLVDLCKAGEKVRPKSRSLLDLDVETLAKTIEKLKPEKVIVVIKRVTPFVIEALEKAKHRVSKPDCVLDFPTYGHQEEYRDELKAFLQMLAIPRVTAEEVKARLDRGDALILVDVRKESVYARAHIRGAICLPVTDVESRLDQLPPANLLVFY